METEIELNKKSIQTFSGYPIPYGAEVQILHKDSNLYLIGKKVKKIKIKNPKIIFFF